jgi:NAD(P)-dependent dehydrogenase (short-subunit alcohol dehydrogenase family)
MKWVITLPKESKVALVTGGNRGIGYELVKQLALKGFQVILTSRDPETGHEAAQKLKESTLDVSFVQMDVDNQESIRQAAITVNERYGRLDVLINNAGVYLDENKKLMAMDPSILETTMETNFFGALTRLVAAEIKGDIKINAVDPGWVSSDMGGPSAPRTPKQAAESILWLAATGPEGPNGGFFRDGKRTDW